MTRNPILDLPVTAVMRSEIALPLQQVLHVYTIGNFLAAWRNPINHQAIEDVFETPEQARHAAAVCAGWLGIRVAAAPLKVCAWWNDQPAFMA